MAQNRRTCRQAPRLSRASRGRMFSYQSQSPGIWAAPAICKVSASRRSRRRVRAARGRHSDGGLSRDRVLAGPSSSRWLPVPMPKMNAGYRETARDNPTGCPRERAAWRCRPASRACPSKILPAAPRHLLRISSVANRAVPRTGRWIERRRARVDGQVPSADGRPDGDDDRETSAYARRGTAGLPCTRRASARSGAARAVVAAVHANTSTCWSTSPGRTHDAPPISGYSECAASAWAERWRAWGGFMRAARELAEHGTFNGLANAASGKELDTLFKEAGVMRAEPAPFRQAARSRRTAHRPAAQAHRQRYDAPAGSCAGRSPPKRRRRAASILGLHRAARDRAHGLHGHRAEAGHRQTEAGHREGLQHDERPRRPPRA